MTVPKYVAAFAMTPRERDHCSHRVPPEPSHANRPAPGRPRLPSIYESRSREVRMHISDIIRRAIAIGERKGWVTFDELNQICSGSTVEPEDIERIIHALSDAGIRLEEE
jgi:hypothetical protein